MPRTVTSVVQSRPGLLRGVEPAIEANAYAVAEDCILTLVLCGPAVELAVAGAEVRPGHLAGTALPPAAPAQDLRGLVESGVRVLVEAAAASNLGLSPADLVEGVELAAADDIADALLSSEAVLTW